MKFLFVFFLSIMQCTMALGLYSESNQDMILYGKFFKNKKSPGIFVDVGGHDGISFSNSYFFEKHLNWHGICIEPNPDLFKQLRLNRNCICINAACSDRSGEQQFIFHPNSFVSGLSEFLTEEHKKGFNTDELLESGKAKEIIVFCESLNDILNEYHFDHIDFLSIDTEGADFAILTSIDFDKYDIKVIAVEGFPCQFQSFMESKNYISHGRIGNDAIFVKKDFKI